MMDAPYPHANTSRTAQHEDAGRPVRKDLVSVGVPSFSVRLLTSFGPLTLLSALAEAKLETSQLLVFTTQHCKFMKKNDTQQIESLFFLSFLKNN